MLAILAVIGVAGASFISTSFDNFTLLIGFYADGRYSKTKVLFGYAASTLGMVFLAHGAATAVEGAPAALLGYLGLVPLAMGLAGVARLVRGGPDAEAVTDPAPRGFWAVLGVMLANSGDTLVVFVSVFADTAEGLEWWVMGAAVAIAVGYAILARWLVERAGAADRLQRRTRMVLPFLLIGIGAYILANTPTDVVP
jgi:cadmium resistance protein CadD (predicted permease)